MTSEIRFRYRVKNRRTGELTTFLASIADIENRAFTPNPFGNLDYDILSRDVYTGIKDRTGKEVFEGDIVRYDDYQGVAEVGFRRIEFVEEVEFKGGCFYPVCNQPPYTFEVIGSIYENPELLK